MAEINERRRLRSDDPVVALHYQLSAVRRDAKVEAVVLVDGTGCLVAGAGAWPVCEELAAYAPLIANPTEIHATEVESRAGQLAACTVVRRMSVDGYEAYLCVRGGPPANVDGHMDRAQRGCMRILGVEAA